MLKFSSTNNSGPWARLDSRTGIMFISTADGDKQALDLKGKILSLDIANCVSGWLFVGPAGVDWQPVDDESGWGNPPSADHKQGCELQLYSAKDFGDAPVRTSRGNSRGWNTFVAEVKDRAEKEGPLPTDKWPTIRIDAVNVVKVGAGSSVDFAFTLAPRDKWWVNPLAGATEAPAPKAKSPPAAMGTDEF